MRQRNRWRQQLCARSLERVLRLQGLLLQQVGVPTRLLQALRHLTSSRSAGGRGDITRDPNIALPHRCTQSAKVMRSSKEECVSIRTRALATLTHLQ